MAKRAKNSASKPTPSTTTMRVDFATIPEASRSADPFAGLRDGQEHEASFIVSGVTYPYHLTRVGSTLRGSVCRLRGDRLPVLLDGNRQLPLGINANQNIGEPIFFVLDVARLKIAFAKTRDGPARTRICDLLEDLGWRDPELRQMLRDDARARYARARHIRRIEMAATMGQEDSAEYASSTSIAGAVNILNDLRGVRIEVAVSMGHARQGSLRLDAARRFIDGLLNGPARVERLQASVRESESGPLDPVDFIDDRIQVEIVVDQRERRICPESCWAKLADALTDLG